MAYLTTQDMVDRFREGELILLTGNDGVINDAVLDRAIADAAAIIDGHLAGRYTLPLAAVPEALTAYGCDIARYRLYDDAIPDVVRERYEAALRYLEQLASGKINLTQSGATAAVPDRSGPVLVSDTPVFGRGALW